jgi:hypothetical protein
MKTIKNLLILCASAYMMASCLNDTDSYNTGFVVSKPSGSISYSYANETQDSLVFASYGDWTLTNNSDWCSVTRTSGNAYTIYRLPVTFTQNTTNEYRSAIFTIKDKNHPSDGYTNVMFLQYATCGDGSFGGSALVKKVVGSDGTEINVTYDNSRRPLSLKMTNTDGTFSRDMAFSYNDYDSLMTVTVSKFLYAYNDTTYTLSNQTLKGSASSIVGQPNYLHTTNPGTLQKTLDGSQVSTGSLSDSVSYAYNYYSNGIPLSMNYGFKVIHLSGNLYDAQNLKSTKGMSLGADSVHCADSIIITHRNPDNVPVYDTYGLTYSSNDNRYCSMDVNQLINGVQYSDPYLLLSFFKYARNSKIIKTAVGKKSTKTISATLNSDKSVSTLTVGDSSTGSSVTYTFTY